MPKVAKSVIQADNRFIFRYASASEFLLDFTSQLRLGTLSLEVYLPEGTRVGLHFEIPEIEDYCSVDALVTGPQSPTGCKVEFHDTIPALSQFAGNVLRRMHTLRALSYSRVDRVPALLMVCYYSNDQLLSDYSANLSKNGIFIVTQKPLGVGTTVNLELRLPTGVTLRVRGTVAHSSTEKRGDLPAGMGIQFQHYEGASQTELALYIDMVLRMRAPSAAC